MLDVEVGVDDGESRQLFDKKQMRDTVIHLMVADGDDIRGEGVHDLDRGKPLVFRIDDRAAEHIACNGIENIFSSLRTFST